MKKNFCLFLGLVLALVMSSCCQDKQPRAGHVILVGVDCLGAVHLQRGETPNMNRMIENGALQLHSRCVRETSSSQNWMTLLSGAPIEIHGVTDNSWTYETRAIEPAIKNQQGKFPTIFDDIKDQHPEYKVYAFYDWASQDRMYDTSRFDKSLAIENCEEDDKVMDAAIEAYLQDQPEFMYVYLGYLDEVGHTYGNESPEDMEEIKHVDELVGKLVNALEEKGLMDDVVLIVTGDHGGNKFSHGGDSQAELEIPILLYGKGVTKGKYIATPGMNYDVASTIGGLLGVEMPGSCRGRFLKEAFEPKDSLFYVPIPMMTPFRGVLKADDKVTLTCDTEGAEIYYTLDGSEPTKESIRYEGPFSLTEAAMIRTVAYKNGCYSETTTNFLDAGKASGESPVAFRLFRNYMDEVVPDFSKLGKPDEEGYVDNFSLNNVPVKTDEDHFAILYTSHLQIQEAGSYKFALTSDDGGKLLIDGKLAVDNDGSHSTLTKYGVVDLTEGEHTIVVEYYENYSGQELAVEFAKGNEVLRPILSRDLVR